MIQVKISLKYQNYLGLKIKKILNQFSGVYSMLWLIFAMLVALWVVGLLNEYKLGGLIHLLVVIALLLVILRFMTGRRRL